jgi:hypothetical protein
MFEHVHNLREGDRILLLTKFKGIKATVSNVVSGYNMIKVTADKGFAFGRNYDPDGAYIGRTGEVNISIYHIEGDKFNSLFGYYKIIKV